MISDDAFFGDFCSTLNRAGLAVEIARVCKKNGSDDEYYSADHYPAITPQQIKKLVKTLQNLNVLGSVIPRDFGKGRAGKNDVNSKNYLTFDLDLKDNIPKEQFSKWSKENKRSFVEGLVSEKLTAIQSCGLGSLWFAMFSGNGLHLWFKCKKSPISIKDPKQYERFYLACIKNLEKALGMKLDQAFKTPAQLIRLPLSQNCKDKENIIQTRLIHYDDKADSSEELMAIQELIDMEVKPQILPLSQKTNLRLLSGDNEHKESLRQALTFENILQHKGLSNYCTGKQKGDYFIIISPWTNEKTPSCSLNLRDKSFVDRSAQKQGDIFNFIAELYGLDSKTAFPKVLSIAEEITGIPSPKSDKAKKTVKKEKNSEITRDDYYKLITEHLPELSKERLTGQLVFKDKHGKWNSAANHLGKLKAEANELGLKPNRVEDYLYAYGYDLLEPRLLIEIPEWDGVDRINILCEHITLKQNTGLTRDVFKDYLKQFGGMIFEKIKDNSVQNSSFILLLVGGQGIGKDMFIQTIFEGLGRYYMEGTLGRNEKDDYQRASNILLWNVSEFDQTARTDVAYLKDFITKKEVNQRNPYLKEPQNLVLRHSLVASSNENDILRDPTGNRRFAIFEIESIAWEYRKNASLQNASLQILAQFKTLHEHRVSDENRAAMDKYIKEKTPPSIDEQIIEIFDNHMRSDCYKKSPILKHNEALYLIGEVAKSVRTTNLKVTKVLTSNGRSRKGTGNKREVFLPENNSR